MPVYKLYFCIHKYIKSRQSCLAEGDVELSTMIVALSFIAAIFAVPFWMRIFASHTNVPVPTGQLLMSILEVLILPMDLTRTLLVKATAAFSPMVAIPAATMPIFQIILLILYLKLGPWIKKKYPRHINYMECR